MTSTTHGLLKRVLEEPSLVARVRELDGHTLGRVVDQVGLEDAGEIVALATTEQLQSLFDDDLWASEEPGQDETFDGRRFALWLEVLLESGEELVADKLVALPDELVTLGLHSQVLVIDLDALAVEMSGRRRDVDLVEKALEGCLYEEIDEFRVIARRHEHWNAILTVLLALDQRHAQYLRRLLERLCHASTEYIEDHGGLYDVLTSAEMIEADAAAEREDRRAADGYVSPSDASSFLSLPRVTQIEDALAATERDPVTRAYFRSLAPKTARARTKAGPEATPNRARFTALLQSAGVIEPASRALPPGPTSKAGYAFQRAMSSLRTSDPDAYALRTAELAFLTNVLVAGSSFAGRRFRPVEAAEAAIAICNLGFETMRPSTKDPAEPWLAHSTADHLFRVGWHITFWEVSMLAADRLRQRLEPHDTPAARASVRAALDQKKPWLIHRKLPTIAANLAPDELDLYAHLLDRCPVLPAPHAHGRPTSFIGSTRDVALVRKLLAASTTPRRVRRRNV